MIVYGSKQCPDTVDCLAALDAGGVAYDFRDIGDLPILKEFLRFRDSEAAFDPVKAVGGIGIPMIIKDDGTLTFDW